KIRVSGAADARNGLWRPFSVFVASAGFLCGIVRPVQTLRQLLPPPRALFHRIVTAREFAREADIVAVARDHARDPRDLVIALAMMLRGSAIAVGAQCRRPRNDA